MPIRIARYAHSTTLSYGSRLARFDLVLPRPFPFGPKPPKAFVTTLPCRLSDRGGPSGTVKADISSIAASRTARQTSPERSLTLRSLALLQWNLACVAQRRRVAGRAGRIRSDYSSGIRAESSLAGCSHGHGRGRDDIAVGKAGRTALRHGRRGNGLRTRNER